MTLAFLIPGEPFAQGRPRVTVRGGFARVYDPPASRNWKATAQEHMERAARGCGPIEGAVHLEVLAVFTCPRTSWRKREPTPRQLHTKRPDADNVLKAVKDAAKGVLWLDDSQVAQVIVRKLVGAQGEAPGVYVQVEELAAQAALLPQDCELNARGGADDGDGEDARQA